MIYCIYSPDLEDGTMVLPLVQVQKQGASVFAQDACVCNYAFVMFVSSRPCTVEKPYTDYFDVACWAHLSTLKYKFMICDDKTFFKMMQLIRPPYHAMLLTDWIRYQCTQCLAVQKHCKSLAFLTRSDVDSAKTHAVGPHYLQALAPWHMKPAVIALSAFGIRFMMF